MCDLDIMVGETISPGPRTILAELGYVPQYFGVEEVDYARHHHLRPMARPDGIRVEIHWSIARPDSPFEIDLDGLWERAQRAEIVGVEALVLSPEDLILHLCLHSSFTHKFRVGLRMCWDIREVVSHYRDAIDWDLLVRRAQQWGIGRYVYLTLRLVRELLAAGYPGRRDRRPRAPGLFAERRGMGEDVHLLARERRVGDAIDGQAVDSRRLRAKVGVLRDILYPSRTAHGAQLPRPARFEPGSISTTRCAGRTSSAAVRAPRLETCGAAITALTTSFARIRAHRPQGLAPSRRIGVPEG